MALLSSISSLHARGPHLAVNGSAYVARAAPLGTAHWLAVGALPEGPGAPCGGARASRLPGGTILSVACRLVATRQPLAARAVHGWQKNAYNIFNIN